MRVSTLSELLGVSEVTVRRDLEALERRGLLERTHGGAVQTQRIHAEPGYFDAITTRAEEKRAIGAAAALLVEPGDTIFLNGGTTTLEVFRHLNVPGIRVVTNHVGMSLETRDRGLELLLVGGSYRAPSNSVVGSFATETIRRVYANKSFVGVEGISLRSGLTTPTPAEAEIARVMIEQTRGEVSVVADHSKMGTVADFAIAGLDRVDRIVVDAGIGDEYRQGLVERGVDVVLAGEMAEARSGDG